MQAFLLHIQFPNFHYFSVTCITWPSGSRTKKPLRKPNLVSGKATPPDETNADLAARSCCSVVLALRVATWSEVF